MNRHFVLWCNDSSIKNRAISALAVLEIPLGMLVFGWLSCISSFPWWTVVGLMAAPMFLLRSPVSIQSGIIALQRYHDGIKSPRPRYAYITSFIFCAIITAAAVRYVVCVQFALSCLLYLFVLFTFCFVSISVFINMQCMRVMRIITFVPKTYGAINVVLFSALSFLFLGVISGVVMRAIAIRICCTLRYAWQGLSSFSQNYFDTVFVMDFFHLPEILPGASSVAKYFSFDQVLLSTIFKKDASCIDRTKSLFVFVPAFIVIYIPVVLYRLNLKASIIIWGLLACALRPVFWKGEEEMRCRTSCRSTWLLQALLCPMLLGAVGWLISPYMPGSWHDELPGWSARLSKLFSPPDFGLRYVLLCAVVLSFAGLLISAYNIRAAHAKALEGAGDYHKGYSDELKVEFRKLAAIVQRWLNATFSALVLTIWSFALWGALHRWPDQLHNVVWTWIRPWL